MRDKQKSTARRKEQMRGVDDNKWMKIVAVGIVAAIIGTLTLLAMYAPGVLMVIGCIMLVLIFVLLMTM
jgi:hypothetical protein